MSGQGLLLLLALVGGTVSQSQSAAPPVQVVKGDVSVCPVEFGDCHLTLVDNSLCVFLAELLNPSTEQFRNMYNCDNREEGIYVCVNVLGRRQGDAKTRSDYTYPYLVELADDYERQLDKCLPAWKKQDAIDSAAQYILYSYDGREVALLIVPFERDGVRFDRLTLHIRDPSPEQ